MGDNAEQGFRIENYDPKTSLSDLDNLVISDSDDTDGLGRPKTKSLLGSVLNEAIKAYRLSALKDDVNYLLTNADGIDTIKHDTGSTLDRTITLLDPPTDIEREVTILKVGGTKNSIVSGPINGTTQWTIFDDNTGIRLKWDDDNSEWKVIKIIGKVLRKVTDASNRTYTGTNGIWYQPSGANLEITDLEPGLYRFNYFTFNISSISGGGYMVYKFQLGTSTTPGSSLIGNMTTGVVFGNATWNGAGNNGRVEDIVIASTLSIRLNTLTQLYAGTVNITQAAMEGTTAEGSITAERIG